LLFQSYQDDYRRDILTTLRAKADACQKTDAAPRQNFEAFRAWLQAQGKTKATIKNTVNYAKLHAHILESGEAGSLMTLSARNKHHAMTALANLAKFQGCYDRWLDIRRRYNLKWSKGGSLQAFERFFNDDLNLDVMLQRVRRMVEVLPVQLAKIIKFACLVGLRPAEVCESARLLNSELSSGLQYYNPERQALEHFSFPEIFLRRTKNAYISFVTPDNLQPIADLGCRTPTWNRIRLACRRAGVWMEMHLCRKIYGSWLSARAIQSEVVDMLQGRVSPSVFSRHYLTPSSSLKDRILEAVEDLARQLL
jgi:hypothetical protein